VTPPAYLGSTYLGSTAVGWKPLRLPAAEHTEATAKQRCVSKAHCWPIMPGAWRSRCLSVAVAGPSFPEQSVRLIPGGLPVSSGSSQGGKSHCGWRKGFEKTRGFDAGRAYLIEANEQVPYRLVCTERNGTVRSMVWAIPQVSSNIGWN
jgi:hypothetical protein